MHLFEAFLNSMSRLGVPQNARILVAVSGGIDSIVLLHLVKASGYDVAAAHANFKLRGKDSDADQAFVENRCEELDIQVFNKSLNVDKNAENIQLRARELRYAWFFEIMDIESFDFLVTAHHQNDRIETFFINLLRGSGIKGLKSIPEKTGSIIRPLLHFEKSEIQAFAKKNKLTWREDVSNASDDYLRNRIRHGIAEQFSSLSDTANSNFAKSMDFISEADACFEKMAVRFLEKIPVKNGVLQIDQSPWNELFDSKPLHKYVFQKLGFKPNQLDQLEALSQSQSGRFVEGSLYKIYRDRDEFLAEPIGIRNQVRIDINSDSGEINEPLSLKWEKLDRCLDMKNNMNTACLDYQLLHFPLIIRKWKPGDRFRPLGMKGTKKLSDFLTDLKLSVPEKKNTYILESDGEICWVIGIRIADTFRITDNIKPCFRIKYNEKKA